MLLGGVGEALILKWVGGKLAAGIATHLAHSGAATATHFAMHSAINTASAVAGTTTAAGAFHVLETSAKANYKLAKKVLQKQSGLQNDQSKALAALDGMDEEQLASVMMAVMLSTLAEGYYESLEHDSVLGITKTSLEEMEPCRFSGCPCPDYDMVGDECMHCDHGPSYHRKVTESELVEGEALGWLMSGMAAEIYPTLENRNGEGELKTSLEEIDTCTDQSCPCWDFDLCEENQFFSRRCSCGHRWREHAVTGSFEWIVLGLAHASLMSLAEDV